MPAFAAYVLWDRWPELRALLTGERGFVSAPSRPWVVRLAGIVAFATLLAFALGAVGRIIYGTGAAATTLMAGGLTGLSLATAFLSARGPRDVEPSAEARWTTRLSAASPPTGARSQPVVNARNFFFSASGSACRTCQNARTVGLDAW